MPLIHLSTLCDTRSVDLMKEEEKYEYEYLSLSRAIDVDVSDGRRFRLRASVD